MNIPDIFLKRRSIRSFTAQKVEKEKIEAILKAAMHAPSAVNKQPWHFIVINERAILNRIMDVHPYSKMFSSSNLGILVCGDLQLHHGPGYWIADCAAATENLLLAATSLGLGSCWVGIYPKEERMNAMREIFLFPEHVEAFALVALGYAAEEKKVPERYQPERVYYNKWGNN
jgi:nitroreductase